MRTSWLFLCGLLTSLGYVSSTPQDDLKTLYDRKIGFILEDGLVNVNLIPTWYVKMFRCSLYHAD